MSLNALWYASSRENTRRNNSKKGARSGAFLFGYVAALLRGRRPRRRLGRLQLLAGFLCALLQLFLQLLLVFLEHLRIGRRAVIGLGELPPVPAAAAAGSAAAPLELMA